MTFKSLSIAAVISIFTFPALAECPVKNIVYSDGQYVLHFDRDIKSQTQFAFKITNIENEPIGTGEVIYNNGYSIPNILMSFPCPEDLKPDGTCTYQGTAYEIKKDGAEYVFSAGYDEKNPILFPQLGFHLYHSMKTENLPKDVWHFKECLK